MTATVNNTRITQWASYLYYAIALLYFLRTVYGLAFMHETDYWTTMLVGTGANCLVICVLLVYFAVRICHGRRLLGAFILMGYLCFQAVFMAALLLTASERALPLPLIIDIPYCLVLPIATVLTLVGLAKHSTSK